MADALPNSRPVASDRGCMRFFGEYGFGMIWKGGRCCCMSVFGGVLVLC